MSWKLLCTIKYKPILSNIRNIIPKRCKSMKLDGFYERDSSIRKNVKLFPKAKYGGSQFVTLISSNNRASIESSDYIKEIFRTANAPIIFEEICAEQKCECDDDEDEDNNEKVVPLMDKLIISFQRNRCALMTDYRRLDEEPQSDRIRISADLRLFVSVTKFFPFPGYEFRNINYHITLIGGNVMAEHQGLEYEPIDGMIETLRITTDKSIAEFLTFVYEYAKRHKHHEVTFVHNHSQFELSDGLFIDIANHLHKKYSDIYLHLMPANELVYNLVKNPRRFDIICCSERYTNLLASILAGLSGGVDLFSMASYGAHHALFQPLENRISLPLDYDAVEMAPYSVISACVQLLLHMNLCDTGTAVWRALIKTMVRDEIKTDRYCGKYSSADVYIRVIDYLKKFKKS